MRRGGAGSCSLRREVVEQRLGLRRIVVIDDALLAERDQRGLRGLRDQPACIAALGDVHLDGATALLGEELLEHSAPLDLVGHQEPARNRGHVGVILREEPAEARRGIEPGDALELVRLHRHDTPLADAEHRGHGAPRLDGDGDAVLVGARAAQHRLALADPFDGAQTVAKTRGELVVAIVGGSVHLVAQLVVQGVGPPLHELLHLLEDLGVLGRVDLSLARPGAPLDVIVEAHSAAPEDLVAAGAEREDGAQRSDRGAQRLRAGVRPEVARAVTDHLARVVRPREQRRALGALATRFAHLLARGPGSDRIVHPGARNLEVEIALVVLEAHVEARAVLLDERVLEDERLVLALAGDHLEIEDAPDQLMGARLQRIDAA